MDVNDFKFLKDGVYEFKTYMDEKFVGIPHVEYISGSERCFVIPPFKMEEHNTLKLSIEEKVNAGIFLLINPDVIDEHNKIR